MKKMVIIAGLLAATAADAGYSSAKKIDRVWMDNGGTVYFGVFEGVDAGLCDNNAGQYAFNATTSAGKNYYATLLAAKMSGLRVDIWWNGGLVGSVCNWANVSGLGISQNQ